MSGKTQIFGDQIVSGTITNTQISATATISASKITPPGSTLQLIYNNAGAFAGAPNITTDGTNLSLTSAGSLTLSGTASGGSITLTSGTGSSGGITLTTGTGGSGTSGAITLTTANLTGSSQTSGQSNGIILTTGSNPAGSGFSSANGGTTTGITITSGGTNDVAGAMTGSSGNSGQNVTIPVVGTVPVALTITTGNARSLSGDSHTAGTSGSILITSGGVLTSNDNDLSSGAGGHLILTTGRMNVPGFAGGTRENTGTGGSIFLSSGDCLGGSSQNHTGQGGSILLTSGAASNAGAVSGAGGSITIKSGDSTGTVGNGGTLTLTTGNSTGGSTLVGGGISITTGTSSGPVTSGNLTITTATGTTGNGNTGGNIVLSTGDTSSAGPNHGGSITLTTGNSANGGNGDNVGGSLTLTTGNITNAAGINNVGGGITLTTGSTAGGNATGGSITLTSFNASRGGSINLTGTGTFGFINLANAIDWTATSAPALSAAGHGRIYYDSGTQSFKQSSNGGAYTPLGAVTSITGTANQVIASSSTGAVTLSLPQSIATSSSPAFQALTLGGTTLGGLILNDTEVTPKTVTIEAPTTLTSTYVLKMPLTQGTANTALVNDGSGNLSWGASGAGSVTQNTYTVGTPLNTYTGSTTLFNLPFTYTQDGKSLQVMYNGQVLVSGVDYAETSNTSVTFTNALTTGYTVQFRYITPQTPSNTSVAQYANFVVGTSSGTYTGSTTVYNLPFAYTQDGKSLEVFYDGVQLVPGDDYTETSSTSITTTQALTSGQKIAFRTISTIGTAAAVTALRENYIVGTASGNYTGSLTVFNLINSYTPGGINLQVFLDGDLQTVGASVDYVETNGTTVTFNNALVSGQKVTFLFSQTVAATGTVTSGTSGQLAYYASTGSTIAGLSALTYNGSSLSTTVPLNIVESSVFGSLNITNSGTAGAGAGINLATTSGANITGGLFLDARTGQHQGLKIQTSGLNGVSIGGTTTNDTAEAGNVGEWIESANPNTTNASTPNGTFTNQTSINLTAGDWDVTGIMYLPQNGTAFLSSPITYAISIFSGNTTTDHKNGDNVVAITNPGNSSVVTIVIPTYRISLASPTTVYWKTSTGGTNTISGCGYRLSARRVR